MSKPQPKLSLHIDRQLLEQMEREDKELEALRETDPAEYARRTEPINRLRERLDQARKASSA